MLTIIFVIIIFVFTLLSKTPKFKGKIGELKIHLQLITLGSNFTILDNVIIKTKNGLTTQIDHIVLSIYGIFIIETKNYKGWIFGNDKIDKWTQVIYNNKYYFNNPVKQNLGHVYSLKHLLSEYNQTIFYPIIVFTNNAILKDITSDIPVIYESELINTILKNCTYICLKYSFPYILFVKYKF